MESDVRREFPSKASPIGQCPWRYPRTFFWGGCCERETPPCGMAITGRGQSGVSALGKESALGQILPPDLQGTISGKLPDDQ
jgi:hypothetical protein